MREEQEHLSSMTYRQAQEYITMLNNTSFAGYKDWRLPTLEEAMSLVERDLRNGWLHIDPYFTKLEKIWTSDRIDSDWRVWVVSYNRGYCLIRRADSFSNVRAVRSNN
jgi:hypothetical protein